LVSGSLPPLTPIAALHEGELLGGLCVLLGLADACLAHAQRFGDLSARYAMLWLVTARLLFVRAFRG
jgi:hypothetical protein